MNVLIAGGGRIGSTLASRLLVQKHTVTVVERDRVVCDMLFQELGIVTVFGDACDPRVLERAGIAGTDVAVGTLARDADNLAFALVARSLSSARLMVRMLDGSFRRAYRLAGIRDVIDEAEIVVGKISTAIELPLVIDALPLPRGDAHLVEVPISAGTIADGKTLAELRSEPTFPKDCVFIGLIDDEGNVAVPDGSSVLRAGLTALLVARKHLIPEIIAQLTDTPAGWEPISANQLRRVEFLSPLSDLELTELTRSVSIQHVNAGETLFRLGDPGDKFFVVLTGEIDLTDRTSSVLERVPAGGVFGEIALLTGQDRMTAAVARVTSELVVIPKEAFRRILLNNPGVAGEMTRILGQRLASVAKPSGKRSRPWFGR